MSENPIVYSSEKGDICPKCQRPTNECICKQMRPKTGGIIYVRREVKGRRGKAVATITGLPLNASELKQFASELKRKFGTGGSVKNGVIEIQGDVCDQIVLFLKEKGYRVKRSGG